MHSTTFISMPTSDDESGSVKSLDSEDGGMAESCGESIFLESNDMTTKERAAEEERQSLGKKETRAVMYIRILVVIVLIFTAVLVSLGVFFISRHDQNETFESEFVSNADKVMESFRDAVERKLGALDSFSVAVTSHAISVGATFPNVTLPDYEVHACNNRILADGLFVFYSPVVTDDARKGWEAYATENQGHLFPAYLNEVQLKTEQDIKYGYNVDDVGMDGGARALLLDSIEDKSFREEIWGPVGAGETQPQGIGPYSPLWQISPVLPLENLLNFDYLDFNLFAGPYAQTIDKSEASFGDISYLQDPEDPHNEAAKIFTALLGIGQFRHKSEEYEGDPISTMSYPVFDGFGPTKKVAAILGTALYWRFYFANLLPPTAVGIICVLENNFGQAVTYRIDGPTVTYLGSGDLHDAEYDYLEASENIAAYLKERAGPESRSYTAVDLNDGYVSYTLHVFPSDDMKDEYLTNEPMIYTIVVASVFVFTSLIFLMYDCVVERRQKVVLNKAVKSTAMVRSLFPKNVEDRLFNDSLAEVAGGDANKNDKWRVNKLSSLRNILADGEEAGEVHKGKPIADLFPEATVLFADLGTCVIKHPPKNRNSLHWACPHIKPLRFSLRLVVGLFALRFALFQSALPSGAREENQKMSLPCWKLSTARLILLRIAEKCSKWRLLEIATVSSQTSEIVYRRIDR
jgi:hypothetical protein